ncbi:MAG: Flp pilus assembly complex ATPase component TadA, partial [Nitrospirae bacterium]|nr:Flp pilus assembly complex ATPase component TadA [Nitrospirota bacterium]
MSEDCSTFIEELLLEGVKRGASDIHLTELSEPYFRIDGDLQRINGVDRVDVGDMNRFLDTYILAGYKGTDGDFSFTFGQKRWRGNFFYSNSKKLSLALRILPFDVPDIDSLDLPVSFKKVADMKNGLVLVTGPTGSGKSTTIAAMIRLVVQTKSVHLITIENPVEYLFEGTERSKVDQREVGSDTKEISEALKYALRQDPDVILVGEIRDMETARLAVAASETGHLVFATLHTVNAVETVNRLCGLFSPAERHLVQQQVAAVLNLVVAQTLLKKPGGGRRATVEALFP